MTSRGNILKLGASTSVISEQEASQVKKGLFLEGGLAFWRESNKIYLYLMGLNQIFLK